MEKLFQTELEMEIQADSQEEEEHGPGWVRDKNKDDMEAEKAKWMRSFKNVDDKREVRRASKEVRWKK